MKAVIILMGYSNCTQTAASVDKVTVKLEPKS